MKKLLIVLIPVAAILIYSAYTVYKSKEDFEKPSQVVEDAIRESDIRREEYQNRQLDALILICVDNGYITKKYAKSELRKINDNNDKAMLINRLDSIYKSRYKNRHKTGEN